MDRRGFLKGLVALAAVAVAPSLPLAAAQTEHTRLMAKFATGLIEDEIFYLDGGIVISGLKNLTIRRCKFVFFSLLENESPVTIRDCDNVYIDRTVFHVLSDQRAAF